MKIRSQQMEVFADEADRRFECRLAKYLRETYGGLLVHTTAATTPLKSIEDGALRAMVRECIGKARSRGVTWESSIAAFAVLMFLNGPNFDEHPAIRSEMGNSAVPSNSLPDHVAVAIPESVWQQVRADYRGGW